MILHLRQRAMIGRLLVRLVRQPKIAAFCAVNYCMFLGTTILCFMALCILLATYLLLLVAIWKCYMLLHRVQSHKLLQKLQCATWNALYAATVLKLVCVAAAIRHVFYCSNDPWPLLQYLLILYCGQHDIHVTECHLFSSGLVMLCGALAGMPIRIVSMLACKELLHPTFGKRAAPTQEPSMRKRPATAAPSSWKPEDHDDYLRRLMGARPGMTLPELCEAIARDYSVVIERDGSGYYALKVWLATLRSTNLSRQQLSEYYTDWVQEQRRAQPHLKPFGLLRQLLDTGLRIDQKTFQKWWADLPLPPEPMDEASATVDPAPQSMDETTGAEMPEAPMSDAAFSECKDAVWAIFIKNPHLGAAAMATKLLPAIGVVQTHLLEQWLTKAQKEPLSLHRLRCFREAIEDYISLVPNWTQAKVRRFLADDYNVTVERMTVQRLFQEMEAPEGMPHLTGKQLGSYDDYLLQFLEETPTMGPVQLLRTLQSDKQVTTTIAVMRQWRDANVPAMGCRRVPCSQIASDYWKSILSPSPAISHAEVKERLARDLSVWCHDSHLKQFCINWRKQSKAQNSIQHHWQTALDKQFHATSVLSNTRRVPVTAPIQVFRYWTYLLSWAVCHTCGRKAKASWRNPTYENGTWNVIYPDMSNGLTCKSHALWQVECPKKPYEIDPPKDKPQIRFKGSEIFVSPERRHWPVYNPKTQMYEDHAHYREDDRTDEETKESLLDLSRTEAWALAPIRIFMDLHQEQPCVSTRIFRIIRPTSLAQNQFSKGFFLRIGLELILGVHLELGCCWVGCRFRSPHRRSSKHTTGPVARVIPFRLLHVMSKIACSGSCS